MGLVFIGIGELICLIAFPIGIIWLIWKTIRQRSKKTPIVIICVSTVSLFALVAISNAFYADEMEQQRIAKQLEEKLESESNETETNETAETVVQSDNHVESTEIATTENVDAPAKTIEETTETAESVEETTAKELTANEILMDDLKSILDSDVAEKAYDIIINQIGFTTVKYIGKNSFGDSNYDFKSDEYSFMMTASDDVYRIFQPSGGFVFYENGEVINSVADAKNKAINNSDRHAYYFIAQEIVENGLKNPKSADFPSTITRPGEIAMSKNGDIIAVQSYVDAQNSFGAVIRTQWLVEFRVIDLETYSYELLYANIDGEILYGTYIELSEE